MLRLLGIMPVSELQSRYPLATERKFWKKFSGTVIIALFLFAVIALLLFVMSVDENEADTRVISGIAYILTALSLVYVVAMYWYFRTYIKRYYYSADADFLTIKKGVFAPTEIHIQYQKIQDVYVDQDFFDLLFGIYDVHVASATASSAMEAHIDGLLFEHAEQLKTFLLDSMRTATIATSPQTGDVAGGQMKGVRDPVALAALREVTLERYPLTKEWYVGEIIKALLGTVVSVPGWYFLIFLYVGTKSNDAGAGALEPITQAYFGWLYVACALLFALWRFIRLALWVAHYRYAFEQNFIAQRVGVITVEEKHMPYEVVQNIIVNQGVIDRLLGIADVVIENAATQVIGHTKTGPITAQSAITVEGLFLSEAESLAAHIRTALFGAPSSKTGL